MKPQTKQSLYELIEHACRLQSEYEVAKQSAIVFDQLFKKRESDEKIMRRSNLEPGLKAPVFRRPIFS